MKKTTIYLVKMGIWGADEPTNIYFETRLAAAGFYESHDYCDKPVSARMSAKRAAEMIAATTYYTCTR